jgi:hypothetical protein
MMGLPGKALHLAAIPLRSGAAGDASPLAAALREAFALHVDALETIIQGVKGT